jgi:type IV secretory pathway TrbF-like protein
VALVGALTTNWVAAAGVTATVALPRLLVAAVSFTSTVWLPAVTKVTPLVKVCTPLSPATNV